MGVGSRGTPVSNNPSPHTHTQNDEIMLDSLLNCSHIMIFLQNSITLVWIYQSPFGE